MYVYPELAKAKRIAKQLGAKAESSQKYPFKLKITYNGKEIHIGDRRYSDFLQHKDKKRRELYQKRHANDKLKDKYSRGYWAFNVLW